MMKTIVNPKGFFLYRGNTKDAKFKKFEGTEGNQVIDSMPPARRTDVRWDGKEWVTDALLKWKKDMKASDNVLSRKDEDFMDIMLKTDKDIFNDMPERSTYSLQKNIDKKALRETRPE